MKYLTLTGAYVLVGAGAFLIASGWYESNEKTVIYGGIALWVSVIILCTNARSK